MNLKPTLFIKKIVQYNTIVMIVIKQNSKLNKKSMLCILNVWFEEEQILLEVLCSFLRADLGIFKGFLEFQETSLCPLCLTILQKLISSEKNTKTLNQ